MVGGGDLDTFGHHQLLAELHQLKHQQRHKQQQKEKILEWQPETMKKKPVKTATMIRKLPQAI